MFLFDLDIKDLKNITNPINILFNEILEEFNKMNLEEFKVYTGGKMINPKKLLSNIFGENQIDFSNKIFDAFDEDHNNVLDKQEMNCMIKYCQITLKKFLKKLVDYFTDIYFLNSDECKENLDAYSEDEKFQF